MLITTLFATLGARTGPQPIGPGQTVIISFTDETIDKIDAGAFEADAPGVVPHFIPSYRLLHGRLMERLAVADPLLVVWDYYFPDPSPDPAFDAAFARGAARPLAWRATHACPWRASCR
jgi:hypothetical protein